MPERLAALRVLADDLSGACDCAASFSGACGTLPVFLAPRTDACEARFAIDLDTRRRTAAEASRDFAAALHWAALRAAPGVLVYKKIDSTLRGHLGAEFGAMLDAFPTVVVAPAFPAQGRTLVEGRPHVDGVALEGWPGGAHVVLAATLAGRADVALVRASAIDDVPLDEAAVRTGRLARVFVVDAASEEDLERLARKVLAARVAPLLAGSSGLARALAGPPRKIAIERGPVLILCGSFSATARAQVARFRADAHHTVIPCAPHEPVGDAQKSRAVAALRDGNDVLVHLAADIAPLHASRDAARTLAEGFADAVGHCGTLALTGGDTARAVLETLGIEALRVAGEWEPGIAVSEPISPTGPRVVLKAGGFGDNGVWNRIRP